MFLKMFIFTMCLILCACALDKSNDKNAKPAKDSPSPTHQVPKNTEIKKQAAVKVEEVPKTLDWLVENSSTLAQKDNEGQTVVHKVVEASRLDLLVKLMTQKNFMDLNVADNFGRLPLHYAKTREIASLLWQIETFDRFHNRVTLDYGLKTDFDGNTPLHLMAERGDSEAVAFATNKLCETRMSLFDRTSQINTQNKAGQTPLHMALLNTNTETLSALFTCNELALSQADGFEHTPLDYAVRENDEQAVTLLLGVMKARGKMESLYMRDEMLETPLFIAHRCSTRKVQGLLETYGSATETVNKFGQRPDQVTAADYHQTFTNSFCGKTIASPSLH